MKFVDGALRYSASDLVYFLECQHLSFKDWEEAMGAASPVKKVEDEFLRLICDQGIRHEKEHLESLKAKGGKRIAVIPDGKDIPAVEKARLTLEALHSGADVVYQAVFLRESPAGAKFGEIGIADFLMKVPGASKLGDFHYEPHDTKLALHPKPYFAIQLCFYADLLEAVQGVRPANVGVILGDKVEKTWPTHSLFDYYLELKGRYLRFLSKPATTPAEPCAHCSICPRQEICAQAWEEADHLSLVAGLTKRQRIKLSAHGITTLGALAKLGPGKALKGLNPVTLRKIQAQASLQARGAHEGKVLYELIGDVPVGKGFDILPPIAAGDIFYDIEGDASVPGGLEYLHGIQYEKGGAWTFKPIWAHDPAQEKKAVQEVMDFITLRRKKHPAMRVFHYAAYETSALKRLTQRHTTHESELDDLLRSGVFVDLYAVVRQGLRVSERSYSLKSVEKLCGIKRQEKVATAMDSVVMYAKWKAGGGSQILEDISVYNKRDIESTRLLRDWLVERKKEVAAKPAVLPQGKVEKKSGEELPDPNIPIKEALLEGLDPKDKGAEAKERRLLAELLDFFEREGRPKWWHYFYLLARTAPELVEETEALAFVEEVGDGVFTYEAQPCKFKVGDQFALHENPMVRVTVVAANQRRREIRLAVPKKAGPLPDIFSLVHVDSIGKEAHQEVMAHFIGDHLGASGWEGPAQAHKALGAILRKKPPVTKARKRGEALRREGQEELEAAIEVALGLDGSHLVIQGPPGTGKTWLAARLIHHLALVGKKVGVTSNSHKVINHLLEGVARVAEEAAKPVKIVKKASSPSHRCSHKSVENFNSGLMPGAAVQGGTSWYFSGLALEQGRECLDYLVVDEAGQFSFADLIASGYCARNIILVGDHMQLPQPLQGTHSDEAGVSAIEAPLHGESTVPPDMGILLETTHRMCPEVCGFISGRIYEGRIKSAPATKRNKLHFTTNPALLGVGSHGIHFVPVEHHGNTLTSEEEAEVIAKFYKALLGHECTDAGAGKRRLLTPDDILVVAPYNMQVQLLEETLGKEARVGTVDLFQGQEALVSLVSMTTSDTDEVPRNKEFLYSRNRLNVALSRAKCLSVVFASEALLGASCSSVEQMQLVNLLCGVRGEKVKI